MLIDRTKTERLDVPHEPGSWVEIRPLTGLELDMASDRQTERAMNQYGNVLETIVNISEKRAASSTGDRKQAYDPTLLLKYAIARWSAEAPVTPENIELLDARTRDWLWEEVVKRNTRPPESESV